MRRLHGIYLFWEAHVIKENGNWIIKHFEFTKTAGRKDKTRICAGLVSELRVFTNTMLVTTLSIVSFFLVVNSVSCWYFCIFYVRLRLTLYRFVFSVVSLNSKLDFWGFHSVVENIIQTNYDSISMFMNSYSSTLRTFSL